MAKREPLHYAVLTRDVSRTEDQIRRRDVDVTARNRDGDTALHMLSYPVNNDWSCYSEGSLSYYDVSEQEIIRRLASVDKRCFTVRDAAGNTPLMRCVKVHDHCGVMSALLEHERAFTGGTDFDAINNKNESVLDLAFARGKYDYIEIICSNFKRGDWVGTCSTTSRLVVSDTY